MHSFLFFLSQFIGKVHNIIVCNNISHIMNINGGDTFLNGPSVTLSKWLPWVSDLHFRRDGAKISS